MSLKRPERFVIGLGLAITVLISLPLPAHAQMDRGLKATCPVMQGERVSKKFYVDHEGQRVYLCCRPCIRAFKRNPEKYMAILRGETGEAK